LKDWDKMVQRQLGEGVKRFLRIGFCSTEKIERREEKTRVRGPVVKESDKSKDERKKTKGHIAYNKGAKRDAGGLGISWAGGEVEGLQKE